MYKKLVLSACLGLSIGTSAYAQINPNIASGQLTAAAKQKVQKGGINLTSLLNNSANDLIVEYELTPSYTQNSAQVREYYQQQKQRLQAGFKRTGGFELLREYNGLPVSFHRIQNRDTLVQLLNDPNVKAVYPNRISYAASNQSYELIGQTAVAAKGFKGDGTTIAVLDTGTNYKHADFGSCTNVGVPASTCRVSNAVEIATEDNSLDDSGHGSNVAGIASKVAPNAKIASLDIFRGKSAYDSDMISALNWVANNAKALNIKAANLSIVNGIRYTSTCTNSALSNAFTNIRKVGVIPVVSAGNDGFTDGLTYPACTAGAVSVGATYDSNVGNVNYNGSSYFKACSDSTTYSDKVTCFSDSSPNLTLFAPGVGMVAGGYNYSGTSQAAPHVAAAIALLTAKNAYPNDSIDQITARLRNTGTLITDQRNNLRLPRLNLTAALAGVTSAPPVTDPPVVSPTPPPTQPVKNCRIFFFMTICNG